VLGARVSFFSLCAMNVFYPHGKKFFVKTQNHTPSHPNCQGSGPTLSLSLSDADLQGQLAELSQLVTHDRRGESKQARKEEAKTEKESDKMKNIVHH